MNHPAGRQLRIVDAHVHLHDSDVNRHGFLDEKDDVFEALVGDYSALPKKYQTSRSGRRMLTS